MGSEELERLDEYLVWSLVWYLGMPSDCKFGLGERAFFSFFFSSSFLCPCTTIFSVLWLMSLNRQAVFVALVVLYTWLLNTPSCQTWIPILLLWKRKHYLLFH
jgi:hypothetical protein